jgi:hypothetical protein
MNYITHEDKTEILDLSISELETNLLSKEVESNEILKKKNGNIELNQLYYTLNFFLVMQIVNLVYIGGIIAYSVALNGLNENCNWSFWDLDNCIALTLRDVNIITTSLTVFLLNLFLLTLNPLVILPFFICVLNKKLSKISNKGKEDLMNCERFIDDSDYCMLLKGLSPSETKENLFKFLQEQTIKARDIIFVKKNIREVSLLYLKLKNILFNLKFDEIGSKEYQENQNKLTIIRENLEKLRNEDSENSGTAVIILEYAEDKNRVLALKKPKYYNKWECYKYFKYQGDNVRNYNGIKVYFIDIPPIKYVDWKNLAMDESHFHLNECKAFNFKFLMVFIMLLISFINVYISKQVIFVIFGYSSIFTSFLLFILSIIYEKIIFLLFNYFYKTSDAYFCHKLITYYPILKTFIITISINWLLQDLFFLNYIGEDANEKEINLLLFRKSYQTFFNLVVLFQIKGMFFSIFPTKYILIRIKYLFYSCLRKKLTEPQILEKNAKKELNLVYIIERYRTNWLTLFLITSTHLILSSLSLLLLAVFNIIIRDAIRNCKISFTHRGNLFNKTTEFLKPQLGFFILLNVLKYLFMPTALAKEIFLQIGIGISLIYLVLMDLTFITTSKQGGVELIYSGSSINYSYTLNKERFILKFEEEYNKIINF